MLHKCNKCGRELEYTNVNFYKQKDGLRKICKQCVNVDNQKRLKAKKQPKETTYKSELYIKRRLELGLSQVEASVKIGISYQTLANIEQDRYKTANIKTIQKLNEFYAV